MERNYNDQIILAQLKYLIILSNNYFHCDVQFSFRSIQHKFDLSEVDIISKYVKT